VTDPTPGQIDSCLKDNRCVSTTAINQAIQAATTAAPSGDITHTFTIVITVIINSGGGVVNLGVDVIGDHEPTDTEKPSICHVVSDSISKTLKFESSRVHACTLTKVTSGTTKRSTMSTTSSYVANIQVADSMKGSASALVPTAVALLVGLVALVI